MSKSNSVADNRLVLIVGVVLYTALVAWVARSNLQGDYETGDDNIAKFQRALEYRTKLQDKKTLPESELGAILTRFDSDKARHHGYDRYYDRLLGPLRNKKVRLVEIGVEKGRSLRTWQVYFGKKAQIYGIGYGNFQEKKQEDCSDAQATQINDDITGQICKIYRGDQGDTAFLQYFVDQTGGNYDVFIDDGSHLPSHQLISFEFLWPHISPGGVYIIEDIETNFWRMHKASSVYGYTFEKEHSIMPNFMKVVNAVNREYLCGESGLKSLYDDIESIQFGQNVIILRKMQTGDTKLNRKPYRFASNVACNGK